MSRNKQKIKFRLYEGVEPIYEDGYDIGTEVKYSKIYEAKVVITPIDGVTTTEIFGDLESYDRVITTEDLDFPLDEESIVWLDDLDSIEHEYVVKRRSRSLNLLVFALSKVKVSS